MSVMAAAEDGDLTIKALNLKEKNAAGTGQFGIFILRGGKRCKFGE